MEYYIARLPLAGEKCRTARHLKRLVNKRLQEVLRYIALREGRELRYPFTVLAGLYAEGKLVKTVALRIEISTRFTLL